jgi:ABC-type transport system involved in cytochrome bd biosynthesis fused ATPase/permease subunit
MKVLRAFGLGIFLLTLLVLMPTVFFELAKTAIVFLQSSQAALYSAGTLASYAGTVVPQ